LLSPGPRPGGDELPGARNQERRQEDRKKHDKKDEKKVQKKPAIPPTHANVSYGKHERNVMDFWQAKSDKPTPVVICIHGGSLIGGDKSGYYGRVKTFLDAGISVATINYRLMKQANEEKVVPPVKAPLEDAARAVQFVRSRASEWNIDKKRVGATGGSAGGRPRFGTPSTTTWPTPRAPTRSRVNPPDSIAPPWKEPRPRWTPRN